MKLRWTVQGWWIEIVLHDGIERQIRAGVGFEGWYFVLRWNEERYYNSGSWRHENR
jgi:hypothetical protein